MAYERTVWVKGQTPLSAENFNNIEEGIEQLNSDLSNVNDKLNSKADKTSLDDTNRKMDNKADKTTLSDLIKITNVSRTISGLGAGLAVSTSISYSTPSGYKLIGSFVQDTGNAGLMVYTAKPDALRVRNVGSTRIESCVVILSLIFIKI